MIIRRAVLEDADRLVEMRRTFQQEAKGNPGSEAFARSVKAYLEKHIPAGTCIVWLAEEGEEVACCAMLSCVEELPTLANPGGRKGVSSQCVYPAGIPQAGAGGEGSEGLPAVG